MDWIIKKVLPVPAEPSRRAMAAGRPGVFRDMGVDLVHQALRVEGATDKAFLVRFVRKDVWVRKTDRLLRVCFMECCGEKPFWSSFCWRLLNRLIRSHLWRMELVLSHGLKPQDVGLLDCLGDLCELLNRWVGRQELDDRDVLAFDFVPRWLVEHLSRQETEEDLVSLCLSFSAPAQTTLRVNTLKCTVERLSRELQEQGVSVQSGLYSLEALRVQGRPNLMGSIAFREGFLKSRRGQPVDCTAC